MSDSDSPSDQDVPRVAALLEEHRSSLLAFLRLQAGAVVTAKESISDLAQSVCREALEDEASYEFRSEPEFRRWLFTRAAHKVADRGRYYRREKRDVAREQPANVISDGESRDLLAAYATFCTPSMQVVAREEVDRIEQAFEDLPEEQREAILLSRLAGLSYAEIGARIDRSETAIRGLVARGLARLARLIHSDKS